MTRIGIMQEHNYYYSIIDSTVNHFSSEKNDSKVRRNLLCRTFFRIIHVLKMKLLR